MLPAGKSLRTLREKLGLTMRDVENSSARVADKYRNEEFSIPPSRLSDIETKGILPSIFRLYTHVDYLPPRLSRVDVVVWRGPEQSAPAIWAWCLRRNRMCRTRWRDCRRCRFRCGSIPAFDDRRTTNLGRMVEQWGLVPIATSRNLPTAISPTATSARRISPCIRFCRPAVSFRWTNRRIELWRAPGARNTSVPFILWKPATGIPAAGAACAARKLFCSLIRCLRFRFGFCATRRKPKCSAR